MYTHRTDVGRIASAAPRRSAPQLLDDEAGESAGRLDLDRHVVDDGAAGAMAGPLDQVRDIGLRALESRFDPAVGKVADPPRHATLLGEATERIAEEDTLDPPGNQQSVADHRHRPTVHRQGTPSSGDRDQAGGVAGN